MNIECKCEMLIVTCPSANKNCAETIAYMYFQPSICHGHSTVQAAPYELQYISHRLVGYCRW
jgi:hypothetical protein